MTEAVEPPLRNIMVIKSWDTVATWKHSGNNCCAICKNDLQVVCLTCVNSENNDCSVSYGACNHHFHSHCVQKWVSGKGKGKCPTCHGEWEVSRVETVISKQ